MMQTHGIRFDQTQFWVTHRRQEYGPFDYDWSADFRGMELLYQGTKFGEVCSPGEVFADMREFSLPRRVVQVASIVLGCTVLGVSNGLSEQKRALLLTEMLSRFNCHNFLPDSD